MNTTKCGTECWMSSPCFARIGDRCSILMDTVVYKKKCPFHKPKRNITNGVKYPEPHVTH